MDNVWEQEKLEARKSLKNAANPTCRLHALLGAVELEDSLAEKDTAAKLMNIFTHNFDIGNNQKTDLPMFRQGFDNQTQNYRKPTLTDQNEIDSKTG